jgi:hypothetical protein
MLIPRFGRLGTVDEQIQVISAECLTSADAVLYNHGVVTCSSQFGLNRSTARTLRPFSPPPHQGPGPWTGFRDAARPGRASELLLSSPPYCLPIIRRRPNARSAADRLGAERQKALSADDVARHSRNQTGRTSRTTIPPRKEYQQQQILAESQRIQCCAKQIGADRCKEKRETEAWR